MLRTLYIENYALIRQSEITFDRGFVAITGETGAGKSIMLGALALLLGQRADGKTLYDQTHKCIVEANFDANSLNLKPLFDDNDVDYNDDGTDIREEDIPADMLDKAQEYRTNLIEAVIDQDEELMEKYFEG
ncbi:MAG: AAA family ATPase, partial [Bacteroidales bacterium]|nr:AAA family ATPase [Bacteroidales bacterium]